MSKYISISAFTLAEFSVALTILTLVSGLMLSSLFFINKWSANYQSITNKYEDMFDCATVLKTDYFLSDKISLGNNKLGIINAKNDTINYYFSNDFITRQVNRMHADTINIPNIITFNLNNNEPESFSVNLILNRDTLKVVCETSNKMMSLYN